MSSKNGYIGSLLVHLAVIGAAVGFAYMKPEIKSSDDQDPLMIDVWTGDGSERAPGIPGRDRGAAQGHERGDKLKSGLPRIKSIDAKSIIRKMKEAEARAAAEADREARAAKAEKAAPDKNAKVEKRETLDDFKKAVGKTNRTGTAKGTFAEGASGAKKTTGGKGVSGITGGRVGSLKGNGSGEPAFGRANGTRANGGDGGSGNAVKLFYGEVKGKFSDAYQPLWEDMGGGADNSRDAGRVRLAISPTGVVSFAGWATPPTDPLLDKVVRAAVAKMGNVGRPPPGADTVIILKVTGSVDEE